MLRLTCKTVSLEKTRLTLLLRCEEKPEEKIVYYESRKREVKIRLMDEVRCDERLKGIVEEST